MDQSTARYKAIPLLAEAAARVVTTLGRRADRAHIESQWKAATVTIRSRPDLDIRLQKPLADLVDIDDEEADEDPTLAFAVRVARFLIAMPSPDVSEKAADLLDVVSVGPDEARDTLTDSALRVVKASADALATRVHAGHIDPLVDLGNKLTGMSGDRAVEPAALNVMYAFDSRLAFGPSDVFGLRDVPGAGDVPPEGAEDSVHTRQSPAYVNVGFADDSDPTVDRKERPFRRGDQAWLWVEIGPRSADALPEEDEPLPLQPLEVGRDLEIVLFPDEELTVAPSGSIGWLRVVDEGPFPVVEKVVTSLGSPHDESLLSHRVYARVTVPYRSGSWRIRVGVFVKGVLVHVQQVTIPVGIGAQPTDRTTFRLLTRFGADDDFTSLVTPTVTIYANASDDTHDFSFYLPNGADPAVTKPLHLDSWKVKDLTDLARKRLRFVSWGDEADVDDKTPRFAQQRDGTFADPDKAASAIVDLAVAGHNLWLAFSEEMERDPAFRDQLRDKMSGRGTVQLAIKDAPELIVPLQLLYDDHLDTSAPNFLHVCQATEAWLHEPDGDPPCLGAPCPDAADDQRVCIAGFWGLRHAITINPAYRPCRLTSEVPSAPKPPATLATSTDQDVSAYWSDHATRLRQLVTAPDDAATTSTKVFESVKQDESVLLYFLAHVDYQTGVPRIVMNTDNPKGALNVSTIESQHLDLCPHQPLVFINACASAGMSPERLLGLIDGFIRVGAGGAVGTEIMVFVDFAVAFAEQMLTAYADGQTLGESLRRARLDLLRRRNPLGFAYLGFGLHDLRLVPNGAVTGPS